MKVCLEIEFDTEAVAEGDLSAREQQNIVGVLQRIVRHRLEALECEHGKDHDLANLREFRVCSMKVTPLGKVR